jgi:hypothetical protein
MSTFRKTFAYLAKNSTPTDYIQKINEIKFMGIDERYGKTLNHLRL